MGFLSSAPPTHLPPAEGVRLDGAPAAFPADFGPATLVVVTFRDDAAPLSGQWARLGARLAEATPGPMVQVDVIDQGEGIPAIHLPRLTERFYRVDAHRSRERGGTGLGLAIVKHIVQRHRGRLLVESAVGEGSTFSVLLPRSIG